MRQLQNTDTHETHSPDMEDIEFNKDLMERGHDIFVLHLVFLLSPLIFLLHYIRVHLLFWRCYLYSGQFLLQ